MPNRCGNGWLLAERDAVEEKLGVAAIAMGHGFTRGWRTRLPGKFSGEGRT
jgi:hypothetical protein